MITNFCSSQKKERGEEGGHNKETHRFDRFNNNLLNPYHLCCKLRRREMSRIPVS
jgi:hypothetical protein